MLGYGCSVPPPQISSRASDRLSTAALVSGGFIGLLWLLEILDVLTLGQLDLGIRPLSAEGLLGILTAPLLHVGFVHLVSNTITGFVLCFLILLFHGVRRWLGVTVIVWLLGGLGTWLIGGVGTNHLGASGVIFGWLTFLITAGFLGRHPGQALLGVVVFILYGGMLGGVLPTHWQVSWQGHLAGAIAGIIAAWWLGRAGRRSP